MRCQTESVARGGPQWRKNRSVTRLPVAGFIAHRVNIIHQAGRITRDRMHSPYLVGATLRDEIFEGARLSFAIRRPLRATHTVSSYGAAIVSGNHAAVA